MIKKAPKIEPVQESVKKKSIIEEITQIKESTKPMVIGEDEVKIQTPDQEYTKEANVSLMVSKLIKKNDQPIRPFSITYTFHENKINKEVYSTWGQELKAIPVRSRINATFQIAKRTNEEYMSIGKKDNGEMKIQTDDKGQFIGKFMASDIESTDEIASTHTQFEDMTDDEENNIKEISQQKTPAKKKILQEINKIKEEIRKDNM